MLILTAVVAAILLVLGYVASAKGFVLGGFFSILNFLIMIRQVRARLGKERKAATVHSGLGLGLRMLIMAVPLVAAYKLPGIDPLFAAIGLFNLQVSIFFYGLVIERFNLESRPSV